MCPKTVAVLKAIPSIHGAMFAALPPGGRLNAHRDPFAGSLRYHLGLVCPNDDRCFILVDGERYSWRDGQPVMFDETFVHYAENGADTTRIVLFCDVERPLATRAMTAINRFICHRWMKASTTQNVEGERVGIANKVFGVVYQIRIAAKAFKKRSRRGYYAVKYAAMSVPSPRSSSGRWSATSAERRGASAAARAPGSADENDEQSDGTGSGRRPAARSRPHGSAGPQRRRRPQCRSPGLRRRQTARPAQPARRAARSRPHRGATAAQQRGGAEPDEEEREGERQQRGRRGPARRRRAPRPSSRPRRRKASPDAELERVLGHARERPMHQHADRQHEHAGRQRAERGGPEQGPGRPRPRSR
jgi:hypothetical protein